ncbi:MAG: hypothetical protein ACRDOZ_06905 [Nocardioides sp.]
MIDLADQVSVNCCEHPESLKERVHLRYAGDAFPHASGTSRKPDDQVRDLDFDHVVPYDPGGPPGQTGTHNSQPLGRTGHRAKTHVGFPCTPLPTGEVIWRTRHGLHRIVDRSGTHPIDDSEPHRHRSRRTLPCATPPSAPHRTAPAVSLSERDLAVNAY